MLTSAGEAGPGRANLLADFYELFPEVIAERVGATEPCAEPGRFTPGYALPDLASVRELFAPAEAVWRPAGTYGGHPVTFLDLTANPATQTAKTAASLLIVARAIRYIRETGEPIIIVTPTSANKGVALRDAVLRAITLGLVRPSQLRIAVIAPGSAAKLRSSRLSEDPGLRALNPLFVYGSQPSGAVTGGPERVKELARAFASAHAAGIKARTGANVWFTLDLDNYVVADAARAFFEAVVAPPAGVPRVHAHAVSSAFGMLGYHTGRALLEKLGAADASERPRTLLVQHLATPDMVLYQQTGAFDRTGVPAYVPDPDDAAGAGDVDRADGTASAILRRAGSDPRFPEFASAWDEVLDPTFYTHQPATSHAMKEIISLYGGDGIVVSRAECEARYPVLREWFAAAGMPLPEPSGLREWSTVMAGTGVMNAIDRGLLPDAPFEIVVHASGSYGAGDYIPVGAAVVPVETAGQIAAALI